MRKPDTVGCQSIDMRRLIHVAAITAKTLIPHIIGHDQHNVSFYVAATVAAFDRNLFSGELIPIQERKPQEVLSLNGKVLAAPGVKAYNPAFDITPQKLISAIVCELGVIRAPYDQNLRNLFSNLG